MLDGDVEDETDKPTSDHEAFVELVSFVELVKIAQSVAAAAVQETTTIGEVCLTKRIEFR